MATNIASEEENNDEAAWWIPDLQAPPLFYLRQRLTEGSSVAGNIPLISLKKWFQNPLERKP